MTMNKKSTMIGLMSSSFIYFLAMPKDFRQCYVRNLDVTINLIGEGMLVENFKAIRLESSFGISLILESVTRIS